MPKRGRGAKVPKIDEIPEDILLSLAPAQARVHLDGYALRMQRDMGKEWCFERLSHYLHKYIWGLAYNRYIVRGHEGKDLYQEGLIALRFKAIPKFNPHRGMSFLNFAKMCIKRHLITLLNQARNRKKDKPMNDSVPIEILPGNDDEPMEGGTLLNVLSDTETDFIGGLCRDEDKRKTIKCLGDTLSPFERAVLTYFLEDHSYREIAKLVSKDLGSRFNEKSIDNALLRIRSKATGLRKEKAELPLFMFRKKANRRRHSR